MTIFSPREFVVFNDLYTWLGVQANQMQPVKLSFSPCRGVVR